MYPPGTRCTHRVPTCTHRIFYYLSGSRMIAVWDGRITEVSNSKAHMTITEKRRPPHLKVKLPNDIIEIIDEEIERGVFRNRTHAMRTAIEAHFGVNQDPSAAILRRTYEHGSFMLFAHLLANRENYTSEERAALWYAAEDLASRDFPEPLQCLQRVNFPRPDAQVTER